MLIRDTHEQARELCCDVLFFYFKCEIFFFFSWILKGSSGDFLVIQWLRLCSQHRRPRFNPWLGPTCCNWRPHMRQLRPDRAKYIFFLKGGVGSLVQIAFLVSLRSLFCFFCVWSIQKYSNLLSGSFSLFSFLAFVGLSLFSRSWSVWGVLVPGEIPGCWI